MSENISERKDPDMSNFNTSTPELSVRGQIAAVRFLERRGYEILEEDRWECSAGGADVVARDEDGTLIFVEVNVCTDTEKGFPSEKVSAEKRAVREKVALAYLAEYDETNIEVRFDVISIMVLGTDRALLKHHQNAMSLVA